MRGSEADFCRAVAAATLGDVLKVNWVILTTENRFAALQSGEIDLLDRTATWTVEREASLGLLFTAITFFDGTGFMVKSSSGVKSTAELDGATICVLPGTSTERAVADYFRQKGMRFTPVLIDNDSELRAAFMAGRCDAYSTDTSALAATRYNAGSSATTLALLPEVVSKEPLGPVVRKGDDKWFDIVRWTHFAMVEAEEMGVSSMSVDAALESKNPDVRRLLGAEGDLGKALGLDNH
jgi:general L-amino acid transport system substrate-binding protein